MDSLKQVASSDTLISPTDSLKLQSLQNIANKKKKKKGNFKELFNFRKNYPNPKKAVILSAILPGTGQIYNKKYWKLPIVYGGLGAMVYFISFNTTEQKRFQKALELRLDDDPCTIDEFTIASEDCVVIQELLDVNSMRSLRNQHRKWKELSYIGLVFTYILTGVDSYVDAHLINFNVNDDLTLQVRPDLQLLPNLETSVGIGLGLKLRDRKVRSLPVDIYAAP